MKKLEELIEILEEINPDVDYRTEKHLVKSGILTSFEMVLLLTRISEEFGVRIPPGKIVPEIFDSAESIYQMIEELEEEN
ncbi:MAG: acyl carrier protein [Clostridiales bacterium]|nr:acyl carrier protein [Clostridiales bacterium]